MTVELLDKTTRELRVGPVPATLIDSVRLRLVPPLTVVRLLSTVKVRLVPQAVDERATLVEARMVRLVPLPSVVTLLDYRTIRLVPILPEEVVEPEEVPPPRVNWWLWGGLALIAVVVAVAIARRRG